MRRPTFSVRVQLVVTSGKNVGRHIRLDCPIKPIKHLGVPTSDELDLNGCERLD